MLFQDRVDAGQQLARALMEELPHLRAENPLVLAIPRGGVPVGYEVAMALDAPLDVFIARKLGAPGHEELGIGAVAPDGTRVLDTMAIEALQVPDKYIAQVTQRELTELDRRMQRFRDGRPAPVITGRAVVLVDDGLATGVTARAALTALRHEHPRRLVFAAPVCSPEASSLLRGEADATVCLAVPERFYGVGAWYHDFSQTSDEEVVELLAIAAREHSRLRRPLRSHTGSEPEARA
ncbi:MAG TPA: phosphoribosyltransferase [Gemmatimonadaceae bacterium]|nr:phosphoribosyltransferase [Gemmatimonadaceae bacterium]